MKTAQEIFEKEWQSIPSWGDDKARVLHELFALSAMEEYAEQFKQKWISVEEQPPAEGETVIALDSDGNRKPATYSNGRFERYFHNVNSGGSGFIDRVQCIYYADIKKWQPLPPEP